MMIKTRSRAEVAGEIALDAIVFVRKAQRMGCTNKVTRLLLIQCACERGYGEDAYSMRTVVTLVKLNARMMDETHLLAL